MKLIDTHSKSSLLNTVGSANYLGLSRRTLEMLRITGGGPRYCRLGKRCVRYRLEDLDSWLNGRTFESTTEDSYLVAGRK